MNRRSFLLGLLLAPFARWVKPKPPDLRHLTLLDVAKQGDPNLQPVVEALNKGNDQTSIWITSWYHPPDYRQVAGPHPTYAQWRDSINVR